MGEGTKNKMKKQTTDNEIMLNRAKARVAQQSFGIATVLIMGLMVVNIFGLGFNLGVHAETSNNTNLTLNIATGSLELVNVDETVAFSAATSGIKSNETATVNNRLPGRWWHSGRDIKRPANSGSDTAAQAFGAGV